MSKRRKSTDTGAMLDLWRPPKDAGDPVGCLATTYTFAPGLFDEQCLARFLEIESEPNREDLAFLLERESRLGGVYAGVLVDQTQAGVEHSYRWDVLPVRIRSGKQHAKLSLLAWDAFVRIIVASANLTEQGYRTNYEVAVPVDLSPEGGNLEALREALIFLRGLIRLVPGPADQSPVVVRAETFLTDVERRARHWTPNRRRQSVRQNLVFTMPAQVAQVPARSSLDEAVKNCRARGGSPREVRIASPFFDGDTESSQTAASLCKLMARAGRRDVYLCVPALRDEASKEWRIAAPKMLLTTPQRYNAKMYVEALPDEDPDKNLRPWHAKMIAFNAEEYSALMVGSSNFTSAGMGIGLRRNAEANLLTIVQHEAFAREGGVLEAVWPEMTQIPNPEDAEWLGAEPEHEEEEQASSRPVAPGFLAAIYRAGARRQVVLHLEAGQLPSEWRVCATGKDTPELLTSDTWQREGRKALVEIAWDAVQPPEKLLVQWGDNESFLPLNVEDRRELNGGSFEVDVRPVGVHDLLFSHARHQKELKPQPLFRVTGREKCVKLVVLVRLRFLFGIPRPVVFPRQTADPVRLQECHDVLEFVVDRAGCLLFFVTQECRKLEQVFAVNVFEGELWAGLGEVIESSRVRGQRLRLLGELGFIKEINDRRGY
jgi:hypothetical protein